MEDKNLQQSGLNGPNQQQLTPPTTGGFAYQSSSTPSQQLLGQQLGAPASSTPTTADVAPPPITNPVPEPAVEPVPSPQPVAPITETLPGTLTGSSTPLDTIAQPTAPPKSPDPKPAGSGRPRLGRLRIILTTLVIILLIAMLAPVAYLGFNGLRSGSGSSNNQVGGDYNATTIPLNDLVKSGDISFDASRQVNINGQLRINNSFVLTPSDTPENPLIGQFYLNSQNTQLYYYNGTAFVELSTSTQLAQLNTTINQVQAIATQTAALQAASADAVTLPQDLAVTASPTFAGLTLTAPLSVANGGTGATTAAAALTNLGGAASGVNSDITNLNALTAVSPVAGVTYEFDNSVLPGTYDFCTTAGNCAGVGGGVTTTGGTPGRIAKFSAGQAIVDSLLSETGSTVTVNGDLAVTGGQLDLNGLIINNTAGDLVVSADTQINGFIDASGQVLSDDNVTARNGLSSQTRIGDVGPSGEAGVLFGSAGDVSIYRSAANTLKTGDSFIVQPTGDVAGAFQIQNAAGTSNLFVADTTTNRVGVNMTGANYTLDVNGDINTGSTYRINGTSICILSGCVPSSGSSAYIQNGTVSQDANFYLTSAAANQVTGILQGAVGQTADLIQLKNQLGNTVTSVGANGEAIFRTSADSATAFQIQDAGSNPLLIADTTADVIKIGTAGSATQAGTALFASSVEVSGALRVGDATNNIQIDGTTKKITFNGTARQDVRLTMEPEFQGAVLTGDGSNNTGTMTTDFCSGASRLNINAGVCAANDEYNYYSWIGSGGVNDYDVYVRWQVPSNFSAFKDANAINLRGWRSTSSEKVELAMFQQNGTQCGSTTEINNTNTTWQSTNMTGDETACSVSANDVVTFRIRVTAGSSGYARAGGLEINYLSRF